jgi:hypothetical protein
MERNMTSTRIVAAAFVACFASAPALAQGTKVAIGTVTLVELEDLLGRNTIGIPGYPGFDRGRRALDVARRDRQMAILLRNLLDRHVETVLLEDAGLVRKRERRKTGPAGDADADLDILGDGWCRHQERGGCRNNSNSTHGSIPLLIDGLCLHLLLVERCIIRAGLDLG